MRIDLESLQHRLQACDNIAQHSPDPSNKVGCIIYHPTGIVVGSGYNSFPTRCSASQLLYHDAENKQPKYDRMIHSEVRAIIRAGSDNCVAGSLYTSLPPCKDCAKHICEARIDHVYFFESRMKSDYVRRWSASVNVAMHLFAECGVQVHEVPDV
jgi:dCMP deaminase